MKTFEFIVPENKVASRLDTWLASVMPDVSRAGIQRFVEKGLVTSGGSVVRASRKIKAGEVFTVNVPDPEPVSVKPENIPLEILHEDEDIIVVNKPAGLVVHPSAGHLTGTLVNALLYHCAGLPGINGSIRPGIVHRLDMNTTGVLIVAKTDKGFSGMAGQFANREVEKTYLAIVHGVPDKPAGEIKTLIGRHVSDRKRMSVKTGKGREAVTRYETLENFENFSLIRVVIETGRTHQIRVHMAHIGHPVVGDREYGSRKKDALLPFKADRQLLHAWKAKFKHPASGKFMECLAPIPADMQSVLSK